MTPDDRVRTATRHDDRGQTFTLEAVVAAVLLVAALAFALQVTGVTSQSSSTASEHVSNEHAELAAGALDAAAANGTLRATVLYWDTRDVSYYGANDVGYYEDDGPPTAFWRSLADTLDERGLAVNVNVLYTDDGQDCRIPVVKQGDPSDEAGRAAVSLTLTDDDRLREADGTRSNVTLIEADEPDDDETCQRPKGVGFYVPDASPNGPLYNVVRVEVVIWRV